MAIAVSIIVSICAAMAVVRIFGDGGHKWRRDERALAVLARRFARDWEDPAERRALAADLADAVGGGVRITDPRGLTVEALAWREDCHWSEHAPIVRDGRPLGTLSVCFDGTWKFSPFVPIASLLAAIGVLWLMAGVAARRIARPLRELTRVAREIGEGKLASRVRLRHGRRGEVGELTKAVNDMASRIERQIKSQQELLA